MVSAPRLFENVSGDIVLMADLQHHLALVESGLCQRVVCPVQDMGLGFPFLPNPDFLLVAQLLTQLRFGGGILRSAVLEQLPGHGFEDVKERDRGIRPSAQD